jgi:glycosyltransferase involved in cell wall biosynthesis
MLREMVRAGHDIHYLALKSTDTPVSPAEHADAYATRKTWIDEPPLRKPSLAFLLKLAGNTLFSRLPYVLDRYQSLPWREAIAHHARSADLVVCDFLTPAPNLPPLQVPTLLFQHNIESQIWKRLAASATHPLKRWYLASQHRRMWHAEKTLSEHVDGIVTVSPDDTRYCREEYHLVNTLGDVPTGVDVHGFQPPSAPPPTPTIGFLGSMDWMPNIEGVLWFHRHVLPQLRERHPDLRLKIIGRNPPASLQALASEDPTIEVTGTVPEVQPHVHACSVIAVPLLAGGGTRIKIFEAMAMGVPVVSTTIGAEGLPLVDQQDLLLANQPDEFASSLSRLLSDQDQRLALAHRARQRMETEFSWQAASGKFLQFCSQLLDRPPRRTARSTKI